MFGYSSAYRSVVRFNERKVRFLPSPQTSRKAQNKKIMEEIKKLIERRFPQGLDVQIQKFDCSDFSPLVIRPDGEAFYRSLFGHLEALREVYDILYHVTYDNQGVKCVIYKVNE